MSNSSDLPLQVCGAIGGEFPPSIQLFKAVHRIGDERDTLDSNHPATGHGCGVHPRNERAHAILEALDVGR